MIYALSEDISFRVYCIFSFFIHMRTVNIVLFSVLIQHKYIYINTCRYSVWICLWAVLNNFR